MRKLLLLSVCILTPAAHAATVRPASILHSQVVRLRDLFDDAGTDADRVLGPGPAPGGQIVVEASQLAYIARRYGVDWRPAAGAERAVLQRKGRPFAEAEVLTVLRTALVAAGQIEEAEVKLRGYTPPLVPNDGGFTADVTNLQVDPAAARFSAVLSIAGPTIDPITVPIGGEVQALEKVVVAAARLPAGTVLRRDDVRLAPVRVAQLPKDAMRRPDDAIGMALRETLAAGQPVAQSELGAPVLVRKGARVVMRLNEPGLTLTSEGVALESGGKGDRVHVQNPASRAVLTAEVTDIDSVRVEPGHTTP